MGVFYPSLVVNLTLRFDEALTSVAYAPKSTQRVGADPPAPTTAPLLPKDDLTQLIGLVPKQATVELPGYRQAGTFNFTLEYKDLPIDPRAIRACKVEVHLGTVPAGDFARGMTWQDEKAPRPSIINTRLDDKVNEKTLLVYGMADEIGVAHGEGGSEIRIEGRDLRGLLLDLPLSSASLGTLALDKPIHEVVKQIVDLHPLLKVEREKDRLAVETVKGDWKGGPPTVAKINGVTRVNSGAQGDKASLAGKGESDKLNHWDMITQYCFLVGAVPFFKGKKLLVRKARSLYEQLRPDEPSPFAGGKKRELKNEYDETVDTVNWRRMVYGADVLSFKMDRKLAGLKVPTIEVVSINTDAPTKKLKDRLLTARWPKDEVSKKKKATSVTAEGDASEEEILRFPVSGIADKARLQDIAESIYEEIGRGEMTGSVSTKDLCSFGGDNQDPDLVYIRPGDVVELVVSTRKTLGSRPAVVSELVDHAASSEKEEIAKLTARLGSENLATIIVKTMRGSVPELQRFFRVATARFTWAADSGVAIDFDFHNYVEARADPEKK